MLRTAEASILSAPGVEFHEEDEDGEFQMFPIPALASDWNPGQTQRRSQDADSVTTTTKNKIINYCTVQHLSFFLTQSLTHNTDPKRNNELYPVSLPDTINVLFKQY